MKKILLTSLMTVTTALCLSTAHAGTGNGQSAVISYTVDAIDCSVAINSSKDISNIVLKDDAGNVVKKWDDLEGKSYTDFGMYAALLTDGSLYVKSGNNGYRGLGAEIGDTFRDELAACLDTSVPVCPEVVTTAVDNLNGGTIVDSHPDSPEGSFCEIYPIAGSSVGIYNGLSPRNGFLVGARVPASPGSMLVDLTLEEVDACALYMGCNNFNATP